MNLDDFEQLARRAQADVPPPGDFTVTTLTRLTGGARRRVSPGQAWLLAFASASAAAAGILAAIGYQAFGAIEQAGLIDSLELWVNP